MVLGWRCGSTASAEHKRESDTSQCDMGVLCSPWVGSLRCSWRLWAEMGHYSKHMQSPSGQLQYMSAIPKYISMPRVVEASDQHLCKSAHSQSRAKVLTWPVHSAMVALKSLAVRCCSTRVNSLRSRLLPVPEHWL